jgi:hypothetical protein
MIIHVGTHNVQFLRELCLNYAGESTKQTQLPVTNTTAVGRYKMEISFGGFLLSEV